MKELSRYIWDVIGLAETRITGDGELTTEEGHKLYYSGQGKHYEGVGLMVKKEIKNSVINYTAVSSKIILIRIKASPININIIQIYVPTTAYTDEEIEQFYESIDNTIKETPKKDLLIIQGDFNAKVGKDAHIEWPACEGRFGIDHQNERGQRLLEFAEKHQFIIANTLYPHTNSRTTTWHSPDGKTHNQIDYILTPIRFKSSIKQSSTITYPGADINSDHDLVLCNITLKLKSNRTPQSKRIRFNLSNLMDTHTFKLYRDELNMQLGKINISDYDLTTEYTKIQDTLTSTATKIIGKYRKKKQPWMTNDILDLLDKRRTLKSAKKGKPKLNDKYREINI